MKSLSSSVSYPPSSLAYPHLKKMAGLPSFYTIFFYFVIFLVAHIHYHLSCTPTHNDFIFATASCVPSAANSCPVFTSCVSSASASKCCCDFLPLPPGSRYTDEENCTHCCLKQKLTQYNDSLKQYEQYINQIK